MTARCHTLLYPVRDLEGAKAIFTALFCVGPHVDSTYYVGYSVNGAEIGLVPGGHGQGMTGPEPFYDVDDIAATIAALEAAGGVVVQEPHDVGAGLLVARVNDVDGNVIELKQPPVAG